MQFVWYFDSERIAEALRRGASRNASYIHEAASWASLPCPTPCLPEA